MPRNQGGKNCKVMEWHFYVSIPKNIWASHGRPWSPRPGSSQDLTFLRALKVKAKWLDGSLPTSICYCGITNIASRS